jgi:hypothetical protein
MDYNGSDEERINLSLTHTQPCTFVSNLTGISDITV